jgi:hypothetical protein
MDVMGLEDALMTPVTGAAAEVDVADAFPELLENPRALAKAIEQELVVGKGDRYVAPNAELLGIVKQQMAAGFPLEALLDDGEALLQDMERIATRFRKSFFEHIVDPHIAADAPSGALSELAAKVALLRPISVRLVSILLARAIERGGGPITDGAPPTARKTTSRARKTPKKRSR